MSSVKLTFKFLVAEDAGGELFLLPVGVDLQQVALEAAAPVVGALPVDGVWRHVVAGGAHARKVLGARLW